MIGLWCRQAVIDGEIFAVASKVGRSLCKISLKTLGDDGGNCNAAIVVWIKGVVVSLKVHRWQATAAALLPDTTTEQDNQCISAQLTYIYAKKPIGIIRTGCDITINTLVTSQYNNYYIPPFLSEKYSKEKE